MKQLKSTKGIKVGDLVEPKPLILGLTGRVKAIARMQGSIWLFIRNNWLPAWKYEKIK